MIDPMLKIQERSSMICSSSSGSSRERSAPSRMPTPPKVSTPSPPTSHIRLGPLSYSTLCLESRRWLLWVNTRSAARAGVSLFLAELWMKAYVLHHPFGMLLLFLQKSCPQCVVPRRHIPTHVIICDKIVGCPIIRISCKVEGNPYNVHCTNI